MKYILFLLLLCFSTTVFGQDVLQQNKPVQKLTTPDKEVEDFLVWLQEQPEPERIYLRAFTTYAVPTDLRSDVALQLSFLLHSMTGLSSDPDGGSGSYYPVAVAKKEKVGEQNSWDGKTIRDLQLIPGSETLYWIDIRNYNWTPEAWEKITAYDGYMVEPIIQHANNGLLRLLAGNAVVRADWFISEASLSTKQVDVDKTSEPIYRLLTYAQVKAPKTVQEFRAVWGLPDLAKSRQLGNENATLVTQSQNVSRHNRILFGYRTELGWLYQTYDVKHQRGKRDYVSEFPKLQGKPPTTFDGGEIFATNQIRMQIYDLYDDKENLADFADATIVRHLTDVLGDARVQVPHGCFDCHAEGPIPSENTMSEFLKRGGLVYYKDYADKARVDKVYLSDKFEESIKEHQELYAKALLSVNGLTPAENIKSYFRVMSWYNKPVDLKQAAIECGVTEDVIREKAKEGLQDITKAIPGRLSILLSANKPIPRDVWGAPNTDGIPGTFQQTMIVINGLTTITTTEVENTIKYVGFVNERCSIYSSGSTVLKTVEKGTKIVSIGEKQNGFVKVKLVDGAEGWLDSDNLTEE